MALFSLTSNTKPVLKWAGGKFGLRSQLIEYFPSQFKRYVEPFIGGGAVFFSLDQTVPAFINDANTELIELYEVIRDSPTDLIIALEGLAPRYSETFYYEVRSAVPENKIDRAARTIFLNKTGFNGLYRLNSKGGFNVPFGKRVSCPALFKYENIAAVSQRLQNTQILNRDFGEILDQTGPGDFVYCDPPYAPLSATSSFNSYTAGGFSHKEQRRLRDSCERAAKRGANIAISNSSANFIKNLYSDWNVKIVSAKRHINSKGERRGNIDEVLVLMGGSSPRRENWSLTFASKKP